MKKFIIILILLFSVTAYSQITNFRLQRISPIIDMGTMTVWPMVGPVDYYGSPRLQGRGLDIGASEYQDLTVRVVIARAGENHRIVKGDSVQIVASGGTYYNWSTGETTRSLTVNPLVTTTYTVSVTEWDTTSNTEITVTVIDSQILAINAGSDITILNGDTITLTASLANNYLWSTGETTRTIIVSPAISTVYTVETNEVDNSDTDSVIVFVNN